MLIERIKVVKNQTAFIAIALVIILGFYIYSNSVNGKFIWDDHGLVKNNIYIKDWPNLPKIFTMDLGKNWSSIPKTSTEDFGRSRKEEYGYYRPLQMFTYMIDYSLWGLNVQGYHLTNILLHILAALGIYCLINVLYADRILSLFTSILFVAHPIHTEAVAYISGRADPLATIFILLCFIFYIKQFQLKSTSIYILMLLSYILALLSKENSLILPALLLLYHYTFKKKLKIREFLSILSIAFVYILLRVIVSRALLLRVSDFAILFQRMPGFFVAITNYLRLILFPFNLHMEYGSKLFRWSNPRAIAGILIFSSLFIYALRKRKSNRLIFFSISWFFVALLPVSNIYPTAFYMAEHHLYLPSVGFFLILARGLAHIYRAKNFRVFTIVPIVSLTAFYSYLTIRQNNYWKEPISFYKRTLRYAPDSSRVHYNLGHAYYDVGEREEAIISFKKAIEINPTYAKAYNNLGVVYYDIGEKEKAIASFNKAIEINPTYAKAYYNLSMAYLREKQHNLAIEYCDKARELGFTDFTLLEALKPYRERR